MCLLVWNTDLPHIPIPDADAIGARTCARCTRPWPCISMLLGRDLTWAEGIDTAERELLQLILTEDAALGHVRAVYTGDAVDTGRRLLIDGAVYIDVAYADTVDYAGWGSDGLNPACEECQSGPSFERWPGSITYTVEVPAGRRTAEPHVAKAMSGDVPQCQRCGGQWPCASVLVGRDVNPDHAEDILHYGPQLDPERWYWARSHAAWVYQQRCVDTGVRTVGDDGGAIVFLLQAEDLRAEAVTIEAMPTLSGTERDVLRALATAPAGEEDLARALNMAPAQVTDALKRLAALDLVEGPDAN